MRQWTNQLRKSDKMTQPQGIRPMTSCIRPLGYLVFVVLLLVGRVTLAADHPKVGTAKSDDAAASDKSPKSDKESATAAKPESP